MERLEPRKCSIILGAILPLLLLSTPVMAERAVMERSTMSAGSFLIFPDLTKQYTAFTGSGGGDNLGDHVATQTVSAPYGISASTLSLSGDLNATGRIYINTNSIPSLNLIGWGPTIELYNTSGSGNVWDLQTAKTSLKDFAIVGGTTAAMTFIPDLWNVGIINTSPKYRLDVTGGSHFTSSMTVDGGYYGSGLNLTDVLHSYAETDPIFVASPAHGIASGDILDWNGKVNRAGDTMSGQLTVQSSITVSGAVQAASSTVNVSSMNWICLNGAECVDAFPLPQAANEYFLTGNNSNVSAYKLMYSSVPVMIPASTATVALSGTEVLISTYITQVGYPGLTLIPDGRWRFRFNASIDNSGPSYKNVKGFARVYTYLNGVETYVAQSDYSTDMTVFPSATGRTIDSNVQQISMSTSTRIIVRFYAYCYGSGPLYPAVSVYRDNAYFNSVHFPTIINSGSYVTYNTATNDVNLNGHNLTANNVNISSNVYIVGFSSATKYYGDGSSLTGVATSAISTVTIDALPIGTFIQYGSTTPPAGYLYCDGSPFSTTTYSALFAVIGYNFGKHTSYTSGANFSCDNKGYFFRGLDPSGTIDSEARVIGSSETDKFQGHWHDIKNVTWSNNSVGNNGIAPPAAGTGGYSSYSFTDLEVNEASRFMAVGPYTDGTNGTPRTGLETRPKNIAVAVMVKYQNPVVNYNGLTSSNTWSGSNTFTATGAGGTAISSATITTAVIPTITGNTAFSGTVDIGYQFVNTTCPSAFTCTATCPTGTKVLYGGCYATVTNNMQASFPSPQSTSANSWICNYGVNSGSIGAYVGCARIK